MCEMFKTLSMALFGQNTGQQIMTLGFFQIYPHIISSLYNNSYSTSNFIGIKQWTRSHSAF